MTERCCLSVASSCGDKRPISDYVGIRPRGSAITALKLEEIVEGFLGPAWLLRIVVLAYGRGGFTFPSGATGKMLALVGNVLRRHPRRQLHRAFERGARIEVDTLHTGPQIDVALGT